MLWPDFQKIAKRTYISPIYCVVNYFVLSSYHRIIIKDSITEVLWRDRMVAMILNVDLMRKHVRSDEEQ